MAAGGPPVDPLAPPPAPIGPLPESARGGPRPLQDLTIAVTDRPERAGMQPAIADALDTARCACERLGARVITAPAPWHLDWGDLSVILLTEVWAQHRAHAARHDRYRPAIAEFVEAAQRFTDAGRYLDAQRRRTAGAAAWEAWLSERGVDLVLEPTLPIEPYGRGPGYDRGHAGGPGDPMIALTALWDLTGMPVASLPVSWSAGISLIAPRGGETPMIQAAIDLQEHELGVPHWTAPLSESQTPSHE
jgi:aspartyl-tRNA(Asn)/glutamyl-tRNA(Gln) amidotransferase subunit A